MEFTLSVSGESTSDTRVDDGTPPLTHGARDWPPGTRAGVVAVVRDVFRAPAVPRQVGAGQGGGASAFVVYFCHTANNQLKPAAFTLFI